MPPINDNRKLSLLMMEAEEMRDQDSLKHVLQKNQRMFKYLFGRYSGSNAISQSANVNGYSQAPAINQLYDKTIITAEVAKMLRDLGISQQAISKNDIQQLVKLINKKQAKDDFQNKLDYDGFVEFHIQSAYLTNKDQCGNDPTKCLIE